MILLIPLVGFENVAGGVGEFAKWTQTLAVLEVVHSALGGFGFALMDIHERICGLPLVLKYCF